MITIYLGTASNCIALRKNKPRFSLPRKLLLYASLYSEGMPCIPAWPSAVSTALSNVPRGIDGDGRSLAFANLKDNNAALLVSISKESGMIRDASIARFRWCSTPLQRLTCKATERTNEARTAAMLTGSDTH
jgi:hypothetical protein